jgi:hypothetical protein
MTNPSRSGLDKALKDANNDCQGQARNTPLMSPAIVSKGYGPGNLILRNTKNGLAVESKMKPVYLTACAGGVSLPGWHRMPTSTAQFKKSMRAAMVLSLVGPCMKKSSQWAQISTAGNLLFPSKTLPYPSIGLKRCKVLW